MVDSRPSHTTHTALLSTLLGGLARRLAGDPQDETSWRAAAQAIESVRPTEPDLARIVDSRELPALDALVSAWATGATLLPEEDRATLKSAVKAFKKSLKLTRLDDESGIGGGAMSSGRKSGIVGIVPPARFAPEVWAELVRQGKLHDGGHGIFELRAE